MFPPTSRQYQDQPYPKFSYFMTHEPSAMAFRLRKLLNETLDETIEDFCKSYCDPSRDQAVCPISCISCVESCNPFPSQPPPPDYAAPENRSAGLSLFLVIGLAILATTFFCFACYTIYRFYRVYKSRRRSQARGPPDEESQDDFFDEDQEPVVDHPIWYIRTVGLQPSVISAITVCKYKKGEGLIEGTDCSVCLNEFQEDETVRLLPKCNHAFHVPCIDTWLRSHTNCPMCRAGIVINTAVLPSSEQVVYQNSGPASDIQAPVPEDSRGTDSEREGEACELGTRIENEGETQDEGRLNNRKEEVGNSAREIGAEFQPMRRSVSVDSFTASVISAAIANANLTQSGRDFGREAGAAIQSVKGFDATRSFVRLVANPSTGRSLQKGPSPIKRSLSCSAKVFLSRYSRTRNSVLPS